LSANFGEDGEEQESANGSANEQATNVANTRVIDMRAIFAKSGAIASTSSSVDALTVNDLSRLPGASLGHPPVAYQLAHFAGTRSAN
jgi:hypothetical protein